MATDMSARDERSSLHVEPPSVREDRRGEGARGRPSEPSPGARSADHASRTGEDAALRYLFNETSSVAVRQCLSQVRDHEVSRYLQDSVLRIAALLSSEALTGLERVRLEFKALSARLGDDVPSGRSLYEGHAEALARLVFALGRRLDDLEGFLSRCPFSGSGEQKRGLYGQRARDLAGDVRFLRRGLRRWMDTSVPLRGELPDGPEGRSFLQGRIDAVVDDLGLRLKEIQEVLRGAIFDQLTVFDETLTRGKLFKRDVENLLDIEHLLSWLSELLARVRDYDEQRKPEQLEGVKALLRDFRPQRFPTLSGVRESDQILFDRFVPHILEYDHRGTGPGDDPMVVFALLLGDLIRGLPQTGAEAVLFDPDF